MTYKTLEEMIESEYKKTKAIVDRDGFGDEDCLNWWKGRLDAWKWCKEQLERDNAYLQRQHKENANE